MVHSPSTVTLGPRDRAGINAPGAIPRRWSLVARADKWAIALFIAIPVLMGVPPALAGRPLFPGSGTADNLTQNYPLRVLAGELLRHGRLPLWDPYIWSGTPLLAGWNAGALYPGTWLFAILPAGAAWAINVAAVSVICGAGMHVFLRRLGCSPLAALLGALTFTYTGFMSGQAVHLGLVTGMSFTPWMLLAVHELGTSPEPREARRWIALLGGCGGLVVLAGDPRAASSIAFVVVTYFVAVCWRAWRTGRRVTVATVGIVLAALLAVVLSAAQWLPGLSFLHESERAAVTFTRFAAGSLSWHDLELFFVPFLVGGNGTFGLPGYLGSYNLPELSYAVGIVPLVAAFALFRRAMRRRTGEKPLGVWYALIIEGILLSAGANTPLGHVLVDIPLYGGQRLQNRNAVIVDIALAVLLAVFVDVLRPRAAAPGALPDPAADADSGLSFNERLAGLVPVGIVALLVLAAYVLGRSIQRGFGVSGYHAGLAVHLSPYFAAVLVISAGAALLLLGAPRLSSRGRRRLVTIVVIADVLMCVSNGSYTFPAKATIAKKNAPVVALAKLLGAQGRYAIFNPAQSLPSGLRGTILALGPFSLGILHQLQSVQGYSSAVASSYQLATGAHDVENLQPVALTHSNLDILNLKELVTLPEYLVEEIPGNGPIPVAQGTPVAPGTEPEAEALDAIAPQKPLPPLPPFLLSPGRSSTWMLPGPIALDSVTVVLLPHNNGVPRTVSVGILNAGAQTVRDRRMTVSGSQVQVPLKGQVAYGIQVRAPSSTSVVVGAVAVTTVHPTAVNSGPPTHRLVLNQVLQGVLEPPRWQYQTEIGGLPVFTNTLARGASWIEPAGSTTPLARELPLAHSGTRSVEAWQNPETVVSTPSPAVLVRSETYDKGWIARLTPVGGGSTVTVRVRPLGMLQAISIPAGKFVVTWVYTAKLAKVGVITSGLGVLALVLLVFAPRRRRRPKSGRKPLGSPETGRGSEPGTDRVHEPVPAGPLLASDVGPPRSEAT